MASPLELLEKEQLTDNCFPVFIHESLDSTNAQALREISAELTCSFHNSGRAAECRARP